MNEPLPGNDSGGTLPFEGSQEIASLVWELMLVRDIWMFVETGTQRGATAKWASKLGLHVVTIEADERYFEEARRNLAGYGVTQLLGDSAEVLLTLKFRKGARVLFFLDAHGCNIGGTPLVHELMAIREHIREGLQAVVTIHDVQVPDHPELGYDEYKEGSLSIPFVQDALHTTGFGDWPIGYNTTPDGAARGFCYLTPPLNEKSPDLCH